MSAASLVALDRQLSPGLLLLNSVLTEPADIPVQGQCSLVDDTFYWDCSRQYIDGWVCNSLVYFKDYLQEFLMCPVKLSLQ